MLRKYTNMSQQMEISIFCSIKKQNVEVVLKWKKFQLKSMDSKMSLVMLTQLVNNQTRHVSTVEKTETKEDKNGFL